MYYEKFYSIKLLFYSIKLLRSPFLVKLLTFFTRKALKGHLGTRRALESHFKGTWALKALYLADS